MGLDLAREVRPLYLTPPNAIYRFWTGRGRGIGAINYAVRTRCAITFFLFTIIFFRRSLPCIRVFQSDYRVLRRLMVDVV